MTHSIESRLLTLPAKVAFPFRQLLKAGHIADDVMNYVLDAAEITGDTTKLIGFAVGFLHLRSQGVPVHDVIRMAKSQNRRINLSWGAKRWKEEHDRLSRAEALERMAKENCTYNLSKFEEFLPNKFCGYLIRSSRRLGMEGLRQRHCVASYDSRLKKEECAIAVVFVDRRRWTVELVLTNNSEAPLRIVQIKTRYNELPAAFTREQIHKILGIDMKLSTALPSTGMVQNYLYLDNLRCLLPVLRENNIRSISVSFNGGGDDGAIDDITFEPDVSNAVKELQIECLASQNFFENGAWIRNVVPKQFTLCEALDALTYDYLEETGIDWYNDDGGYGELAINVVAGTVSLEVSVRYSDTRTGYCAARDIATGEDI